MITAVIQAGGRSSRMGRDKGLIELVGRRMVERVRDVVEPLVDNVWITTNNQDGYAFLRLPMVSDAVPGAGALPGLRTALAAVPGDFVLVVACDMPFLNVDLLRYQLERRDSADVIVPRFDGRYQPTHAVYRRKPLLAAVDAALAAGKKRMISPFEAVNVLEIPEDVVRSFTPDGRSFFNVNTPEELAAAEKMIEEGTQRDTE